MDPIANFFTIIRNAQAAGRETAEAPFSRVKMLIGKILESEGYIENIGQKNAGGEEKIEVKLKYDKGAGVISGVKRVSRPGQRIYASFSELKPIKQGYGLAIISTSQGIMSDKEARKKKIGGEVLGEIW